MEKLADLHVHTHLSDGTFTPKEVVENARKVGLSCIAITDHDCVDGIEPARKAAKKLGPSFNGIRKALVNLKRLPRTSPDEFFEFSRAYPLGLGLEIIPGVEMTAQEKGREVHLLGFFPDIKDKKFLEKLKAIRQNRVERVYEMVEKLKKYNIRLEPANIFELSGPGSVGRLHVAAILENEGYVSSIEEAFKRFIGDKGPCYVAHYDISAEDAIHELKRVGAVAVYAHPQLMGGDKLIPKFIKYGLDGIEAYHSEHTKPVTKRYLELAKEYGLLVTGGSDCHGLNKGQMLMGKVKVPYSLVEELKRCAAKTKST